MKRLILLLILVVSLYVSVGCSKAKSTNDGDYSNITIRIAQQYGMQYAPVYVMQTVGLLEDLLPGVKLEWSNLGGGSAINEALISNRLDVAFMGIPPALIAIDKGADYRIASGICVPPAELLVHPNSGINSLSDIKPEDKIAVPGIGSIQHIMLSMAAEKLLSDANAFDNNLTVMANPDAYTALISGTDVVSHFASMPYIDLEIKEGMKSILTAEEIGGAASIVCVTTNDFTDNETVYNALLTALGQAIELINSGDEEAMQIIADKEGITVEAAKNYVNWPGTKYTMDLYKVNELADFMYEAGYLSNEYQGFDSVVWKGAREGK